MEGSEETEGEVMMRQRQTNSKGGRGEEWEEGRKANGEEVGGNCGKKGRIW